MGRRFLASFRTALSTRSLAAPTPNRDLPLRTWTRTSSARSWRRSSKALVSLPFDLKVLLEAVADSDLERAVRELAAATVVHVITPKDGNVDAPLRFSEDVVQLRLALAKIAAEGGEGAPGVPRALRRGLRPASTRS